jgi:uncharacterized protein (TIGR02118 family)
MAGAKLLVCYPHPKDAQVFEKAYSEEHLPMAAPILAGVGAQKVVLTRLADSPQGKPHFYRIAEIHFPSLETLNRALGSPDVQRAVADANRISTGGPVVAMISGEEQTITL